VLAIPVQPPATHPASAVTVYWRPGCPFCSSLFRQLERADIAHERVNIWEHPDAAAVVRSIANGNETVPTVVVGTIGMVNPSAAQVSAALAAR
jgi:mycoredoxin